jgi:hypothetical protein
MRWGLRSEPGSMALKSAVRAGAPDDTRSGQVGRSSSASAKMRFTSPPDSGSLM